MFFACKEKRFAKRAINHLLETYTAMSAENTDLPGKALYREVLLHAQQVDPLFVDQILQQAEDSLDQWTTSGRDGFGFREVAPLVRRDCLAPEPDMG